MEGALGPTSNATSNCAVVSRQRDLCGWTITGSRYFKFELMKKYNLFYNRIATSSSRGACVSHITPPYDGTGSPMEQVPPSGSSYSITVRLST